MFDFRILTLNIHKGFSFGNWNFTLEKIRDCLRETGSNIVFLQEVIGENVLHQEAIANWPEKNQFEFLADSVWEHFAYGKNAISQHGHHGNAILSELPFKKLNNVDVSTLSFSQRGILHGQLENGIHLLCVHLGLFESERREQITLLIDYISSVIPGSAPLIVAGDFNDWRRKTHSLFCKELGLSEAYLKQTDKLAKTFPAMFPILSMDRIYSRGFTVSAATVFKNSSWREISDHCALMADLYLETKDGARKEER